MTDSPFWHADSNPRTCDGAHVQPATDCCCPVAIFGPYCLAIVVAVSQLTSPARTRTRSAPSGPGAVPQVVSSSSVSDATVLSGERRGPPTAGGEVDGVLLISSATEVAALDGGVDDAEVTSCSSPQAARTNAASDNPRAAPVARTPRAATGRVLRDMPSTVSNPAGRRTRSPRVLPVGGSVWVRPPRPGKMQR